MTQRTRITVVCLAVLAWFSFLVEGSYALFSDSATLAGSGITTGTVDLQISNSQNGSSTTYADSRPGFPMTLSPGQTEEHFFILKNVGAQSVPLAITATATNNGQSIPMGNVVHVEFIPVDADGQSVGNAVSTTLASLETIPVALGAVIHGNGTQRFRMRTTLDTSVITQANALTYDLVFNGTQAVMA